MTLSIADIKELVALGFTPEQIVAASSASSAAGAESTVVAPPKAPKATPAWIIQHGINKAARRKLAAELRAKGVSLKGAKGAAAWAKAKKEAGIA
jgi:activator of 2-hydroxyglutaryl-CoA dehydratase